MVEVIAGAGPDVIALWGMDWDLEGRAVAALADALETAGHPMPYHMALRPNRARPTGLDLNGNGRLHEPEDAQSYGSFTGENGLAVLSRHPIQSNEIEDYSQLLWADLPSAQLPWPGAPEGVSDVLRLSATSHALIPIETPEHGRLWLGTYAAQTPVFDGPEDRNGRRNADENRFWSLLLDGALSRPAPRGLVIAGHANLDPVSGEGQRDVMREVLADPRLSDPAPQGAGGRKTVDWKRDDLPPLRLSYVLPDRDWRIIDSAVVWPSEDGEALATVEAASRHRLVWVDLIRR